MHWTKNNWNYLMSNTTVSFFIFHSGLVRKLLEVKSFVVHRGPSPIQVHNYTNLFINTIWIKLIYFSWLAFGISQFRADFGNQWGGAYYGGHVYDGYGCALPPPHDPTMYPTAYRAYPMYGSHQQEVSWPTPHLFMAAIKNKWTNLSKLPPKNGIHQQ